jgi:hypothetical protein
VGAAGKQINPLAKNKIEQWLRLIPIQATTGEHRSAKMLFNNNGNNTIVFISPNDRRVVDVTHLVKLSRGCGNSSCQLVEQRLSLLQIARVEPFGEPAVHRSEQVASLIPLALIAPDTGKAGAGAELPGFCLLLARDRERRSKYASAFSGSDAGDLRAISPATRDAPRSRTIFLSTFLLSFTAGSGSASVRLSSDK